MASSPPSRPSIHLFWAFFLPFCFFLYIICFIWTSTCSSSLLVNNNPVILASSRPSDYRQHLPSLTAHQQKTETGLHHWQGDLRQLETAWNRLCFGPPPFTLRIALFVKKWPVRGMPGGLERHALTLHRVLANRGHTVHVYTLSGDGTVPTDITEGGLIVHFFPPTPGGGFNYAKAWEVFLEHNSTQPFDIVHTESVALPHWKARGVPNVAASWHGIAYEVIHSDIVQELIRKPDEGRSPELEKSLTERLIRVAAEVRFFKNYRQHVAISDFVGETLRTIYEIPLDNVHIILNGVDEIEFRSDPSLKKSFRATHEVPSNAKIVFGASGRLVRDKGHPLLFEAFSLLLKEYQDVYLLVAGLGPWGERYKELAPNVITLGPLTPTQMAHFYNSIDVFVNPTLRSQGLDLTLLEAMQCAKPLVATRFSSITRSVITSEDFGYTFSPNVPSLLAALKSVIHDGKEAVARKGQAGSQYASIMFTATKMGTSYERLFLCMQNETYCYYPLVTDCLPPRNKYLQ